jgi:membrane associated rhomboid family serine protease
MRRVRFLHQHVTILGASFPIAPMLMAVATLLATVVGVAGMRNGVGGLLGLGVLMPQAVFDGQVWRLLTWTFFEPQPLSLIFACLIFLFLGRDLVSSWGPERFLLRCLGLVVATGLVTCVVGRFVFPGLRESVWMSAWPLGEALILAWATQFPSSQLLVYFVLPVGGRRLVILTVAGTLLFAALSGFDLYLPHFVAEGLTLAWLNGVWPRNLWLRWRAGRVRFTPQRPSYIRPVEKPSEPPRWLH